MCRFMSLYVVFYIKSGQKVVKNIVQNLSGNIRPSTIFLIDCFYLTLIFNYQISKPLVVNELKAFTFLEL